MTESRNDGITDRLKTVYPPKTSFCGGYNKLFSIRIIHAHLKYIWNKCAKNSNETMKALGGLDFIKYALPAVLYISDG